MVVPRFLPLPYTTSVILEPLEVQIIPRDVHHLLGGASFVLVSTCYKPKSSEHLMEEHFLRADIFSIPTAFSFSLDKVVIRPALPNPGSFKEYLNS